MARHTQLLVVWSVSVNGTGGKVVSVSDDKSLIVIPAMRVITKPKAHAHSIARTYDWSGSLDVMHSNHNFFNDFILLLELHSREASNVAASKKV